MQLSEKPKTLCQFFITFLESTLNFEYFEVGKKKRKKEPHSSSISEVIQSERRAYFNV